MRLLRVFSLSALFLLLAASLMVIVPVYADETLLSVNSGANNHTFTVQGEASLVMNGFDLTPLNVLRPATLKTVTLTVKAAVAGQTSVDLVVYEDWNGGSPVDATLAHRETVTINSAGAITFTLNDPPVINAPVLWIGFYLPVGFKFDADESGSSVLTYWGWTPGGTFDLDNLSSAQVFGPGDGRDPVNVDMNGIARITATIDSANAAAGTPVIVQPLQIQGTDEPNMSVMIEYPACHGVEWDSADEYDATRNAIDIFCRTLPPWNAPPAPQGYTLRGNAVYNISIWGDDGENVDYVLDQFITHCVKPDPGDVGSTVLGVAYGAPLAWHILPSVRYGDRVCAELPHEGHLGQFTPDTLQS
jgi:hypothetical protein